MYFSHLILVLSRKGKMLYKKQEKICAIYGDGTISENIGLWFAMFRRGHFYLEDWECSNRLSVIDDGQTEMLIKNNLSHIR